jgi:hypothetical protein
VTKSLVGQSAGLIATLMAVTSLPYLFARLTAPADLVYTGLMFDVPDHAQYWSWVTASRHALFISNTMTPEPNAATFMNPMMWLLAQAQLTFGLSFPALFQWWRAAAIVLLVPVLVAWVRAMVRERERRSTALLMALIGSGLGWIWVLTKRYSATADVRFPQDLYTVEPNTFWALLGYPNILLAHALILATFLGVWLAYRGKGWPVYLLAAGASACLSVSHAYDLITVYAVLAVFGLCEWIRRRQFPMRLATVGIVIAGVSGPAALYYQHLTTGDPLWRSILSQYSNAGVWTPRHLHLVILMGVPALLALYGLRPREGWTDERRFLTIWTVTGLALVYLPVVYQIKLLSGWQFPIAVLAAHGWHEYVAPALGRRLRPAWVLAVLVVAVSSTNLYLFSWRFLDLRRHAAPYYLHRDEVQALDWLAQHARSSDVVLAPIELGQFVPNYGGSRAYLAHWAMTNRFFERRANVQQFFAASASDTWRAQLLTSEQVTLVMRSEWAVPSAGTFDPGQSSAFEVLFSRPHAQIYRVRAITGAAQAHDPKAR